MQPSAQVVVDIIRDIMRDPNARQSPLFSSPGEDASPAIHMSQSLLQYLAAFTNNSKTPLETEKTLVRHFPSELLPKAHHWLILHGRYVCTARKPQCEKCGISAYCKYFAQSAKASVLTK